DNVTEVNNRWRKKRFHHVLMFVSKQSSSNRSRNEHEADERGCHRAHEHVKVMPITQDFCHCTFDRFECRVRSSFLGNGHVLARLTPSSIGAAMPLPLGWFTFSFDQAGARQWHGKN